MIVQGERVLYNKELQPAQIHIDQFGYIKNIVLEYDHHLPLECEEVRMCTRQRFIRFDRD